MLSAPENLAAMASLSQSSGSSLSQSSGGGAAASSGSYERPWRCSDDTISLEKIDTRCKRPPGSSSYATRQTPPDTSYCFFSCFRFRNSVRHSREKKHEPEMTIASTVRHSETHFIGFHYLSLSLSQICPAPH